MTAITGAAWLLSEPSSRSALLPEQGSDAVCSAVYGQLLLYPDRAKAHLPELIAVMEPLAQDPTDASARLRLYELRDLLQEDA